MRGNRCEVYINDVKSKLFPLGSSGCRSNLPAALFGMTVSINEAGKEKENITKQRDSSKRCVFTLSYGNAPRVDGIQRVQCLGHSNGTIN